MDTYKNDLYKLGFTYGWIYELGNNVKHTDT